MVLMGKVVRIFRSFAEADLADAGKDRNMSPEPSGDQTGPLSLAG